jgi:hypothetical protein
VCPPLADDGLRGAPEALDPERLARDRGHRVSVKPFVAAQIGNQGKDRFGSKTAAYFATLMSALAGCGPCGGSPWSAEGQAQDLRDLLPRVLDETEMDGALRAEIAAAAELPH